MASVSTSVVVHAPPERTFEVFADFARAAERVRGIDRLEVLGDGPIGAGTRFRETRTMFGRPCTEEMEIDTFDPPRQYSVRCDAHGAEYLTTFDFAPHAEGTEVRMEFRVRPVAFLARLMAPLSRLMIGSMAKLCARDMDDLKAAAEGRPAAATAR